MVEPALIFIQDRVVGALASRLKYIIRLDLHGNLISFSDDDEWEGAASASMKRSLFKEEELTYTRNSTRTLSSI
jgi:hypothetical protein